jgi:hypothetical protein
VVTASTPNAYGDERPSDGMGEFFRLCLRKIFCTPLWERAHKLATFIICLLGAAAYFGPRLWPALPHLEDWLVLILVISAIILFRCITAPYAVYKEVTEQRDNLRRYAINKGDYGKIEGPK